MGDGLLKALGLLPLKARLKQVENDLDDALRSYELVYKECRPDVTTAEFSGLLQQARGVLASLANRPKGGAPTEPEGAVLLVPRLKVHETRLIRAQMEAEARDFAAARDAITQAAQSSRIELDAKALAAFEAELKQFRSAEFIHPGRAVKGALAELRKNLAYEVQAASTEKSRLPIDEKALKSRAGLAHAGDVKPLLARVKPGRLVNLGPGPMGIASPDYRGSQFPSVQVEPAGTKFRFKRTAAREAPNHHCTIAPIGEHELGEIDSVEGPKVRFTQADGEGFNYTLDQKAEAGWVGSLLKTGVTAQTYREIELRELEHLVDYSYAFTLSAGRLADAVNALAGQDFDSAGLAYAELVEQLGDAKALAPEDATDPAQWDQRLQTVLQELAGMSIERDRQGTHSPVKRVAKKSGKDVVIEPAFGAKSLDPRAIISMANVPVVYRPVSKKSEATAGFAVGQSYTLLVPMPRTDLCPGIDGAQEDMGLIAQGREVTLRSLPDDKGRAWASVPKGTVKGILSFSTPDMYFTVRAEDLRAA
jgi:hypothetical protein